MPATRSITLTGTVTEDTRLRPLPGGEALAYFTLATTLHLPPAPGAPAVAREIQIHCTAARGPVADTMFDQLKRGSRVAVQGHPLLKAPTGPGPRLRQFNTTLVEPLPMA